MATGDKSVDAPLVWKGNIVYGERTDSLWYEVRAKKLGCKWNKAKPFCPMSVRYPLPYPAAAPVMLASPVRGCLAIASGSWLVHVTKRVATGGCGVLTLAWSLQGKPDDEVPDIVGEHVVVNNPSALRCCPCIVLYRTRSLQPRDATTGGGPA